MISPKEKNNPTIFCYCLHTLNASNLEECVVGKNRGYSSGNLDKRTVFLCNFVTNIKQKDIFYNRFSEIQLYYNKNSLV